MIPLNKKESLEKAKIKLFSGKAQTKIQPRERRTSEHQEGKRTGQKKKRRMDVRKCRTLDLDELSGEKYNKEREETTRVKK